MSTSLGSVSRSFLSKPASCECIGFWPVMSVTRIAVRLRTRTSLLWGTRVFPPLLCPPAMTDRRKIFPAFQFTRIEVEPILILMARLTTLSRVNSVSVARGTVITSPHSPRLIANYSLLRRCCDISVRWRWPPVPHYVTNFNFIFLASWRSEALGRQRNHETSSHRTLFITQNWSVEYGSSLVFTLCRNLNCGVQCRPGRCQWNLYSDSEHHLFSGSFVL